MKDLKKTLTFISNSDRTTVLQETWSYEVPACGDQWVFEKPYSVPFNPHTHECEVIEAVRIVERSFVSKENLVKLYCNIL